jgi:hypothetical protein
MWRRTDFVSMMPMVPRSGVYDLYWKFAAERQGVFERRAAGLPGPWTEDPIIQTFKFCNVFRAADRVSQYLIGHVIYDGQPVSERDLLFRIVAFRIFSSIETWSGLETSLGRQPLVTDLWDGSFLEALDATKAANGGLYTGAFILCATNAFGFSEKHRNHVALFQQMFLEDELVQMVSSSSQLAGVFNSLKSYPLIGDFMAYQLAIDINYSELTHFSESSFVQAGPGALRGIKKVFESTGGLSHSEAIMWMVEHQTEEFNRLGLSFQGLYGRPLQAIDCQGLFCEVDKYCREAVPDLRSARSRIKQRFSPAKTPIELFFPPKWGINDALSPRGQRLQGAKGQLSLI